MRLTDLKTHDQVLQASLQNSDFRREWERTALARTVATRRVQRPTPARRATPRRPQSLQER